MAMTLEEIKALPLDEIHFRAKRAEYEFNAGRGVDEDDLACLALKCPDRYDIKAHRETGEPVIHLK